MSDAAAGIDETLSELDHLIVALDENARAIEVIRERADGLRQRRAAGETWAEIVPTEERPLVVEVLSANLNRLAEAGSRFRRAEARALHREGMTMDRIAALFGVSRQRVSALLRDEAPR